MPGNSPFPKLFIQHIPKTGTTSVLDGLRNIYGKKNVHRLDIPNPSQWGIYIRDPESEWHKNRIEFTSDARDHIDKHKDKLENVPVLHGHHPYPVIWPLIRGTGRKLVTWVRDPISLAISWFYWDKSRGVLKTPHTMQAYLNQGIRNNIIDQMMGWNVDYAYIGFKEWMEQDWLGMCHLFELPATELPRRNVQPLNYGAEVIRNMEMVANIAIANRDDLVRFGELAKYRFADWRR